MGTAAVPIAMMVGSTVFSAMSSAQSANGAAQAGVAQANESNYEAMQQRQNAGITMGEAEANEQETGRQAQLVSSALRAREGANGTSASSSGAVKLQQTIAARGEMAMLNDLYKGQVAATGMYNQGQAEEYEGGQQYQAGQDKASAYQTQAIGTIFKGAGSLYDMYGMGGPKPTPTSTNGTNVNMVGNYDTSGSAF